MTIKPLQKKIHDGWTSTELGLVCDITMGQSPSSKNYNQDGVGLPFFQGKADFTENLGVKIRQWTSEITKESKPYDILMSVRAPVGDVAINNVEACIGRGLAAIRAKENVSEQQFIFQLLQYLKDDLNKKAQGSTFTAINGPALKKIQINLPPLSEQKKIAEILSVVDNEITKIEEIISATEKLKRGLMQKFFLSSTDSTKVEFSKLKDLAKVSSGKTPSRSRSDFYTNGTIPWVKSTEIRFNFISDTSEKITEEAVRKEKMRIHPKGAVLIAMYGQGVTRGRSSILDCDAATNQAVASIVPNPEKLINLYLFYWLVFQYDQLRNLGHGGNQKNLNSEILKQLVIPVPSLSEQKRIIEVLTAFDKKDDMSRRLKIAFIQLKKALQQDLLGARKRVI